MYRFVIPLGNFVFSKFLFSIQSKDAWMLLIFENFTEAMTFRFDFYT